MLFMAIDRQQQIGDQPRKDLHQQAIGAASDQRIHFEVALPPGEEGFYRPAEFVDQGNLLSSQIKAVGGNPIVFLVNLDAFAESKKSDG